jgi:hypothetical protein
MIMLSVPSLQFLSRLANFQGPRFEHYFIEGDPRSCALLIFCNLEGSCEVDVTQGSRAHKW